MITVQIKKKLNATASITKKILASAEFTKPATVIDIDMPDKRDLFIPTSGQTIFTLSDTPNVLANFEIFVNGEYATDEFSVSGTQITFINTAYTLDITDLITVIYQ